uniref:Uncharacterized protein n=1 Tax=Arundo donax TaxID=35708 RepID=A0A0A9A148_ARUDO
MTPAVLNSSYREVEVGCIRLSSNKLINPTYKVQEQ